LAVFVVCGQTRPVLGAALALCGAQLRGLAIGAGGHTARPVFGDAALAQLLAIGFGFAAIDVFAGARGRHHEQQPEPANDPNAVW